MKIPTLIYCRLIGRGGSNRIQVPSDFIGENISQVFTTFLARPNSEYTEINLREFGIQNSAYVFSADTLDIDIVRYQELLLNSAYMCGPSFFEYVWLDITYGAFIVFGKTKLRILKEVLDGDFYEAVTNFNKDFRKPPAILLN